MRIFAMYSPGTAEAPGTWASTREAEGWDGVAVLDHVWTDGITSPHLWVTLGAMAQATTRVRLASSFANGLFRHPVDFAHAALMVQAVSSNRFEAGLGAGWDGREAAALGVDFPAASNRLDRYTEALQIVRVLLRHGPCRFAGEHFEVDVDSLHLPRTEPPILVGSAGRRRTVERIAPLVDCLELKFAGFGSPSGSLDFARLRRVGPRDILAVLDQARTLAPNLLLGVTVVAAAGADRRVQRIADLLGDSWYAGFVGAPGKVWANVLALADLGIDRLQLGSAVEGTYEALAACLVEAEPGRGW
jgi:alkanesulfonate monooxygenase SsuD/methylene tetrahydromethanopterin reductase-like flavin-dependent oxidoreductase (luciferase family)